MLFSLIIPCYNSSKTIRPLMESLTRQGISKEELQIIVVDDNSIDKSYQKIIAEYENRFQIEYYETNVTIHCPGNTRQEGLKHVRGDWLCFADHDDQFESNVFRQIRNYINKAKKTVYMVSTIVEMYDPLNNEYMGISYPHYQVLLHGKFYNMKEYVIPSKMCFKKDFESHEDGWFNNTGLAWLINQGKDWDYLDLKSYRWCYEPTSLSRNGNNERGYLYEHFQDYLDISEPFFPYARVEDDEDISDTKVWYVNQVIMTLLHAYFYYEAASYYQGYEKFKDMLEMIRVYLKRLITELNYPKDEIIGYVYGNPERYHRIYSDSARPTGDFVCKTSFRDFINKLNKLN